jgi:hypothetical protein
VYRAELRDENFDVKASFGKNKIVEFSALTAVATDKSFAEKYLDPQLVSGEPHTALMINIQRKGGVIGYNLKHTDLPEAVLPAGAKYRVDRLTQVKPNLWEVTLYDNGKLNALELSFPPDCELMLAFCPTGPGE